MVCLWDIVIQAVQLQFNDLVVLYCDLLGLIALSQVGLHCFNHLMLALPASPLVEC